MTCQTVGGIQLNSFNLKVKWGKKVGKQWLIGWANRRDNGEEYRRKEEESAEGKTVRCTNKEGWKSNTVDSREGDTGTKFCNRLPIDFHWAPCKFSNSVEELRTLSCHHFGMSALCLWCRGGLEMTTRELSKFDTKPLRHPYELRISSSNQTPLLQSEY